MSGYYVDIDIDRAATARHVVSTSAMSDRHDNRSRRGRNDLPTIEGRERFGVGIRYPQELRDNTERLASVLIPVSHGVGEGAASAAGGPMGGAPQGAAARGTETYVPLGQVATIRQVAGPMVVRTEGRPAHRLGVRGRDGSRHRELRRGSAARWSSSRVTLPPGYTVVWSGQYEYMQRAREEALGGRPGHAGHHLHPALPQLRQPGARRRS